MSLKIYKPTKKWSDGRLTDNCRDHVVSGRWEGLDYALPRGYKIRVSADGSILYSGWCPHGCGYRVVVKHKKSGWQTWYCHLIKGTLAKVGQDVKVGDVIGHCNNTGNSFGNHIHWGLKKNNTHLSTGWVCPDKLMVPGIAAGEVEIEVPNLYHDLKDILKVKSLGIDVSHYQKDFDYARAKTKAPNLKFVYARASIGTTKDNQFLYHYREAKKQGLLFGAYHFIKPKIGIAEQMIEFINAVRYYEYGDQITLDLPLILDFEEFHASKVANKKMLLGMVKYLLANMGEIKYSDIYYKWRDLNYTEMGWDKSHEHGNKNYPAIYTGNPWGMVKVDDENWEFLPLFIAWWKPEISDPKPPNPWNKLATWHVHQFGQGRPSDFGQDVDVNRWNPDLTFPGDIETPPPPPPTLSTMAITTSVDPDNLSGRVYVQFGDREFTGMFQLEEVTK